MELALHVLDFVVEADFARTVVGALSGNELFDQAAQCFRAERAVVDVDESRFRGHGLKRSASACESQHHDSGRDADGRDHPPPPEGFV